MNTFYKTHSLKILVCRNLLTDRLKFLFNARASILEPFLTSVYHNEDVEPNHEIAECIPTLVKHGFITEKAHPISHTRCSLLATNGVNFELTYDCNRNCRHCLQKGIRLKPVKQLSTQSVKDAILQVYLSGLCTTGINFTGGEVLGNRDDLFEILTYTQFLGVPYRLNTNSWWSRKDSIKICGESFSPLELVRHLKSIGLKQFAFSYDDRMVSVDMFKDLIESIKICEIANMEYQIIFTGVNPEKIPIILRDLQKAVEHYLYHMMPVSNEMVDIGACTSSNVEYEWQSNLAPCADKGFYHPAFLHISPDGKVRTCMYALGLANVGNITEVPFADLINSFPEGGIGGVFSNPNRKEDAFEHLVQLYLNLYRPIAHECTRNAVLARTLEVCSKDQSRNLIDDHRQIAMDLSLNA